MSDEFSGWHRAASENLLRAAAADTLADVTRYLDDASHYEARAMEHVATQRQRALGMGLLHAVDLMRAVTTAEFNREEP